MRETVNPMNVVAKTYGSKYLNPTFRVRQKTALSTRPSNPRHLPNENRNASTADKTHAVAKAEIINVSI